MQKGIQVAKYQISKRTFRRILAGGQVMSNINPIGKLVAIRMKRKKNIQFKCGITLSQPVRSAIIPIVSKCYGSGNFFLKKAVCST